MPIMLENLHRIRLASIILIAAGYGWAGGHYIPADSPIIAYIFQFGIITFLLIFGTAFASRPEKRTIQAHWPARGLTIFSILSLLINILNILRGAYKADIGGFGSHNTLADLVPVSIIILGTSTWLFCTFKWKSSLKNQGHNSRLLW
jgi:hypothetical protein